MANRENEATGVVPPGLGVPVPFEAVRAFRQAAIRNNYRLVRVRSLEKRPVVDHWQHGERTEMLLDVRPASMNTGLLLAGLRCIDSDVDDAKLAAEIATNLNDLLPNGTMIRGRAGSHRFAAVYRAPEGQPKKRLAEGPLGKVEVLGAGQQVVVHGLHPSGAPLSWMRRRGPDTLPLDELPVVSEEEITRFLAACAELLGGTITGTRASSKKVEAPVLAINGDLAAGVEPCRWFDTLSADNKSKVINGCLKGLDNRQDDPRHRWLRVLFAVADAERLGCRDARELALDWSRAGASWTGDADFDAAWCSFKPDRQNGIGVGTLLDMASKAGVHVATLAQPTIVTLEGNSQSGLAQGVTAAHRRTSGNANQPVWPDLYKDGNPKPTYRNAQLAIVALGVTCEHDTFHGCKTISGHPVERFAGEITDDASAALRDVIAHTFGFDPGKDHVIDAANALCIKHPYNPVCEWLDRLRWDGLPRLDRWLVDYGGAAATRLNCEIGELLLVAMVRRAKQPGSKFDIMTILEGPQGCGKSSLAAALAGEPENFTDVPLLSKDLQKVAEALRGKWVAEVSELVGLKRSEVEDVKALISRMDDRGRHAYGRYVESQLRTCVLIGTTNSTEYLTDDTGNRRFVPVRVGTIEIDALQRNRDQLFAEAVLREKSYGPLTLPMTVWHAAATEGEARRVTAWVERMREALSRRDSRIEVFSGNKTRITTTALEDLMGLPTQSSHSGTYRRMASAMKELGWASSRWRTGAYQVRGFIRGKP